MSREGMVRFMEELEREGQERVNPGVLSPQEICLYAKLKGFHVSPDDVFGHVDDLSMRSDDDLGVVGKLWKEAGLDDES